MCEWTTPSGQIRFLVGGARANLFRQKLGGLRAASFRETGHRKAGPQAAGAGGARGAGGAGELAQEK
eukprot:4563841-Pyramimonas_sp.AAC.1